MILNALFLATVSAAVRPNDLKSIADTSKLSLLECHPRMVYIKESLTCICKDNGMWPHPECNEKFDSVKNESKRSKDTCTSNGFIRIECNICRCNAKGGIDYDRCTKNICNKDVQKLSGTRRSLNTQIYGTCEAKQWYSMAPCQYCYCSSTNKLLCSTATAKEDKIQLGNYTLTVCPTNLQHDMEVLFQEQGLRRGPNPVHEPVKASAGEPQNEPTTYGPEQVTIGADDDMVGDEQNRSEPDAEHQEIYTFTQPDIEAQGDRWNENGDDEGEESERNDLKEDQDKLEKELEELGIENDKEGKEKEHKYIVTEATTVRSIAKIEIDLGIRGKTRVGDAKWDFPKMLDNFIKLAMRKSMMTLKPNTKCDPGSQYHEGCNLCFCMKNGKVLCTTKQCPS